MRYDAMYITGAYKSRSHAMGAKGLRKAGSKKRDNGARAVRISTVHYEQIWALAHNSQPQTSLFLALAHVIEVGLKTLKRHGSADSR